jgi:TolA-binding protein
VNAKEKTAREFGRLLASEGGPPFLDERLVQQRETLIAMTVSTPARNRRAGGANSAIRFAAVMAGVAAALVLYLAVFHQPDNDAIPFFVGISNTVEKEGRFLRTGIGEDVVVRFDGGSRFEFASATEARVVKASGQQVTIDLTQGKIWASVNPGSSRVWSVRAGPYEVVVKGTIFAVDWDAASAILQVNVGRGRVAVRGPGLDGDGVLLAAGNSLRADARAGLITFERSARANPETAVSLLDSNPSAAKAVQPPEKKTGGRAKIRGTARGSGTKTESPLEMCRRLYHSRNYSSVIDLSTKNGLLESLNALSRDDLWMFANAARYARKVTLANSLFSTYREEYPKTPRAKTAAFLLGKSAMNRGVFNSAKKWFGLYLAEAPNGPLAEEALGHLINIHSKTGNNTQAKRFARDYLSKYGGGYFSKQANKVLEN